MSKQSAGILLFRRRSRTIEVLLVHPGGPYLKKDLGTWSIPKGIIDNEDPLEAAKREFREEVGTSIANESKLIPLSPVKLKGGKLILAWAVEGDLDADNIASNTFNIEWPPRSGKFEDFPEIDKAEWFPPHKALEKINQGQVGFINELLEKLGTNDIASGKSQLTMF